MIYIEGDEPKEISFKELEKKLTKQEDNVVEILKTIAGYITAIITICSAITVIMKIMLKDLQNQNRMQYRYNIVSFSSDLRKGCMKTRDEYLSIFEQIDEYLRICKKFNIQNHLFEEEVKYINVCYEAQDILKKGKTID